MINRKLTYHQRVTNCYDDNREYLEEAIEKYREVYSDFLAEEPFLNTKGLGDLHIGNPFEQYVEKRMESGDGIKSEDEVRILVLVDRLRSLGYIDAFAYTDNLDDKLLAKPYNLAVSFTDTKKIKKFACRDEGVLEGLILPSGEFYSASGCHYTLSNYLMLTGVDTSSAIRTTRMFCQCVIFSDMKGYCENPADVNLTEEQAKAMYNLYKVNSKKSDAFYDVIKASVQVGFLDESKKVQYLSNLELLETTSKALVDPKLEKPFDYLDSRAFEQELRDEAIMNRFQKYRRY